MDIKGGHVAGVCEQLEKTGLIKITSKKVLPSGAIDYVMENPLTGREYYKTTFPPSWNEEKIAQAVWEVYENPIEGDVLTRDKVTFARNGKVDNLEIAVLFQEKQNICIKTLLPYKVIKQ